jgi:hypothetical protein
MPKPKWATPNRQAHLVKLFLQSKGFCVFGHKPCPIPEHHYEVFIENLIKDWVKDDKAQSQAEWEAERKALHSLAERRYPLRGQFSVISKDIFFTSQPQFYLEGIGISGLTFQPFAKVRLASSYMRLYIYLDDTLKDMSKNARRKALRYGRLTETAYDRIRQAVRHYLAQS